MTSLDQMHVQKGLALGSTPAQTINYACSKTVVTLLTEHNLVSKMGSFAKDICIVPKHICFLNEKKKISTFTVLQISKLTFNRKKKCMNGFHNYRFSNCPSFFICFTPSLSPPRTVLQHGLWELYPSTTTSLWKEDLPSSNVQLCRAEQPLPIPLVSMEAAKAPACSISKFVETQCS